MTEEQIIICWEDFLLYIQYPKCSFLLFMPEIPQGLTLHDGDYFNSKWKLGFTYVMQIQNEVRLHCLYVRLYMHYCRQHPHKSDFLLLRWSRTAASDKDCGSCIHLLYLLTPKPWENVCERGRQRRIEPDCTLRIGSIYGRMRRGALETRWPSILALCSLILPTPLCSSSVRICKKKKKRQQKHKKGKIKGR